jgi:Holliday junction resolvase
MKACERCIAELLGGRRVPVSGRTRGDCPDVEHSTLSIECKSRKKLPAWIEDAIEQAEACARDGQLPLMVLHQDGQRYQNALIVTRLRYLVPQGDER